MKFTNYNKRKLEWGLAFYTLLYGIFLLFPFVSMASPAYIAVLSILTETQWGFVYVLTGVLHIIALHINGKRWWTPFARLSVLFLNTQAYMCLFLGFLKVSLFSTAVINYGLIVFVLFIPAMLTAAKDCGHEIAIMRG